MSNRKAHWYDHIPFGTAEYILRLEQTIGDPVVEFRESFLVKYQEHQLV